MALPVIDLPRVPTPPAVLSALRPHPEAVPCAVCDRPIAPKKQTHFVHIVDGGGSIFPAEGTYKNEAADLGLHPVGPECRKKIPKGYIVRMDLEEGA